MGREAVCLVEIGACRAECKVLLETSEVIIRGELKRKFPFASITDLIADDDGLQFACNGEPITLHIGSLSSKWLNAIQNPPSRTVKLGPKSGETVTLVGQTAQEVADELKAAGCVVCLDPPGAQCAWIIVSAECREDLESTSRLEQHLSSNGALWIIYPKGRKDITESMVMSAGKEAGLTDTKTLSYSSTHTGLKFVIPVVNRGRRSE